MSYALVTSETPGEGLARVIHEQVHKLRREAPIGVSDPPAFVHKARVRCKRIRAALRLAQPLMAEKAHKRETAWWRDAARELSDLRDISARIEALDSLSTYLRAHIGVAPVVQLRDRFATQRETYAERRRAETGGADPVAAFIAAVEDRHGHDLKIHAGTSHDLIASLGEGYGESRRAMKAAFADGGAPAFHEWRKKAKAHALQLRLMRRLPEVSLGDRPERTRDLTELLGGLQDIGVLIMALRGKDEAAIGELLGARMNELTGMAGGAGAQLFGLKRKAWLAHVTGADGDAAEDAAGDPETAASADED